MMPDNDSTSQTTHMVSCLLDQVKTRTGKISRCLPKAGTLRLHLQLPDPIDHQGLPCETGQRLDSPLFD